MEIRRISAAAAVVFMGSLLAACGSDSAPPPQDNTPNPPPPPPKFAVGGTVTGLTGTGLELTSGTTTITIDADGEFEIFTGLADDTAYDVSVTAHPADPHQYCTVENGTGTATDDVTDIAVTCVAAVKIAAQVTDEPIAHATVTVKVGDQFYTTVADENGMFSLNIPALSDNGAAMVVAEAEGADDQAHVTFANILGTLTAVVASADENGLLDGSSNAAANVTNVSTARYVLTVQANNGEVPTTGEALQVAERSVDATAVLQLAAAIKLIVDKPADFKLPDGKTSILEFAQDKDAVDAFIAAAPAGAIDQAMTEILADTSLVPGYKAADVPGVYFTIPAAQPGFASPQGSVVIFDEDGTGEFYASSSGYPSATTLKWEVIDGIVKVRYDHPVTTHSFPGVPASATDEQKAALSCAGIGQVEQTWKVTEREYSLLTPGALVDQVRVTALTEFEYLPIAVPAFCDPSEVVQLANPEPEVTESTTGVWKHDALPDMPFSADEIVDQTWGIFMLESAPELRFAAQLVEFAANGTASIDGVGGITWEITDEGSLQLTYGDWVQEVLKLQVLGNVVKPVSVVSSTVDEDVRYALLDLAVRKDDTLLADGAAKLWLNKEGEFWHAYTNGWTAGAWNTDGTPVWGQGAMTFGWSFRADNEAWNHQFFYEPYDYANGYINDGIMRASAWHREMVWEMDDYSEKDGWIGFYGPYYNACYNNYTPTITCQRRDWIPLGKSATGYLYVLESVEETDDNGTTWYRNPNIAPRITPVKVTKLPTPEQEGESFIREE